MHQSIYSIVLIACLILFGIYRRMKRSIGWQRLSPRQLRTRAWIFLVIGLLFLVESALHPISLLSDVIGIALGVALAIYGARMTAYEQRGSDWYYRPNSWIGGVVIVLFLGRLAYRFYVMSQTSTTMPAPNGQAGGASNMQASIGNPWTTGLLLIMFAYYVVYFFLLLRHPMHHHSESEESTAR